MVRAALLILPSVADVFEVIVVNDGSSDRTLEIAQKLSEQHPNVRVVNHPVNRGYGAALKSGFEAAKYEWTFFTDGDQQFDLSELNHLLQALGPGTDAVVGYRLKRRDPRHRALNAYLYKTLIRILFGLKIRDIDCAFKLIRTSAIKSVPLKSDGALISAELLIRLKKRGAVIREVGVNHYPRVAGEQSGANLKVIMRMFRELFALAGELKREEATSAQDSSTTSASDH